MGILRKFHVFQDLPLNVADKQPNFMERIPSFRKCVRKMLQFSCGIEIHLTQSEGLKDSGGKKINECK
jgi:hypothetical protein